MEQSAKKGFTLLELLIVITILAILTLVVILFINPVEILKKSRDVQRLSDLSTMKTAVALYLQDRPTNTLGGSAKCITGASADDTVQTTSNQIHSSLLAATTPGYKAGADPNGGTARYASSTTSALAYSNNGTGWVHTLDFTSIGGGAPIERLPVDPSNTEGDATAVAGVDSLYYRYVCKTNNTFEFDATLESDAYKYTGTDDKTSKDGGNSNMRFEVGTNLNLLPSTAPVNFTL